MYINKLNTHIIPFKFEYHAPKSVEEAVELLSRYGEEASILAGGTDLLVKMKQRLIEPKHIIDIKRIKDLTGIREEEDGIHIGAATKLRTLERSKLIEEKLPVLHEAVITMGSIQIRNMATIGGNLCNASPSADAATPLLALNAEAKIVGSEGERIVPLEEFFIGPGRTVLKQDEMLVEVISPYLPENSGTSFMKIGWTNFDIATVNLAVVLKLEGEVVDECRIALGGCAPTPIRVHKAEDFLRGKKLTDEVLEEAANIVSGHVRPRARWRRAPPEYRRAVSRALTIDALTIAKKRIEGVEVNRGED